MIEQNLGEKSKNNGKSKKQKVDDYVEDSEDYFELFKQMNPKSFKVVESVLKGKASEARQTSVAVSLSGYGTNKQIRAGLYFPKKP